MRLILLAVCVYATTLAGSIPLAHAQGGVNGPRPKAGAPTRPTADRSPTKTSAKANADASAGDTGSAAYREFIEQALNEFKLENWPEARLLFRRAHELNPNARTLRSIGMTSFEMRDYVSAAVALNEALADTRQPLTPAQWKECEALLARTMTFLGTFALELKPFRLTLTVDGAPAVFDAEGRLLVPFGEHTLQASAPDYETTTKTLSVKGGESAPLAIELRRPELQPMAGLDSDEEHAPRYEIVAGSRTPVPVAHTRRGGLRYTWAALGASAAFGGAAIGTWMAGQNKFQTLKDECDAAAAQGTACKRGETDVSVPERFSRATNVLLGLSAASLLTAVVLLPIEWPRERRLALGVGPGQLSIRGSF
jgi:hypothetical protein